MSDQIVPWVAPNSIRWYKEGQHCSNPRNGDVILVDHGTSLAWAITKGEQLTALLSEPELKGFTWLDHCALIIEAAGGETLTQLERKASKGEWLVSEMGPRGHELRPLLHYQDRLYCVVDFEVPDELKALVIANDKRLWGIDYDWLTYVPLFLNGLSGTKFTLTYGSSMICSCALTMCVMGIYWFPSMNPAGVIPSHIAYWLDAKNV